ncbi:MAG TPA: carbamoyltransferase C-terminal domain-containing protein [Myxococcota bacterium]|nr:carbamoyltransferase C-terminal domain-containing protein [Myxococcota bacterium]
MTNILGINAFHADASAVLLKDGVLVGAIAEERLNRVKHFAGFPAMAIRKLLEMGGLTVGDLDHIAIGRDAKANLTDKIAFSLQNLTRISKLARQRLENRANIKDIPELLAQACGVSRETVKARVHHVEHHLCHAASTYLPSGFDRAAILSIDGFGDFASTVTAIGEGDRFKVLDRILFPHSLGVFYSAICQFIGYDKYGDEGKVMGLAPYGKPTYLEAMRDIVRLEDEGRFSLNLDYFIHHSEGVDYGVTEEGHPTLAPLYSEKLIERFGAPRVRGSEIAQRDMDLAFSMQARFEEVYFHILRHLHKVTGCDALCVAGGVSLNSVGNGKIFEQTGFARFYAHPAATDDGTAFGAAYFVHHLTLGNPRGEPIHHGYFGDEYSDEQIAIALAGAGLLERAEKLDEDALCTRTAKEVAQGKVVGWFQGRMEWGPRALGARSIVAHPGFPGMKDILNARIKHREWFRPFAPSILEERVGDYFTETHPSPFMMLVYRTRPQGRDDISATDHIDHTGRLQSVSRRDAPRYYKLIESFERETGIPVILNTSFNENEPIVCRPEEAIDCFMRTKMDALAIGSYLIVK